MYCIQSHHSHIKQAHIGTYFAYFFDGDPSSGLMYFAAIVSAIIRELKLLFNNPPAASFSLWPDTFNQPKFF